MGYFKDWQKNGNNIREALNRLPGDQEPQAYITNSREDVARMGREYEKEQLAEVIPRAVEAHRCLVWLYNYDTRMKLKGQQAAPPLNLRVKEFVRLAITNSAFVRDYLRYRQLTLKQGYLSERLLPRDQLPPSSN